MGATTAIKWTDSTFNPWWGCERVSPGCNHCYAETFAKRTGHDVWGKKAEHRFFGDKHWAEPVKWNRLAETEGRRHRVFCASMADVFQDRDDLSEPRSRLFELILATPHLDWQLLTKRPENVKRMVPWPDRADDWPPNVWIGATVEDQQRADERIPYLLSIPACVRFLSCEPLLGPVKIGRYCQRMPARLRWSDDGWQGEGQLYPRVDWVICGGESGAKYRPLNLDHARSLAYQCGLLAVPFFFKQVGGRTPTAGGDELDGRTYKQFPTEHAA